MGGGDIANLETGVCAWVWVSSREMACEYPSHEKKDDRAGPLRLQARYSDSKALWPLAELL